MAAAGEEGLDYESDPEETKPALAMRRRREASDDEGGEGGETERPPRSVDSGAGVESDGELDGEGAPAEYDEEGSEVEEEEIEEDEELEEETVDDDYVERGGKEELGDGYEREVSAEDGLLDDEADGERDFEESTELQELNEEEGEKKEIEPFAVPTAGAFYMHDDRFGGRGGGRNRRMFGGRRLWESKDDNKWGHDKFEEMTAQDGHFERGRRNSRGHSRGRGRTRGSGRGYPRGNKNEPYENNNQSNVPKGFRGRGPRKYEPSKQNHMEAPHSKPKQSTSGRTPAASSNNEEKATAGNQIPGSSLSSASPPFYPSGNGVAMTQKKDVQTGTMNQNLHSTVVDEKRNRSQSNTMMRGKNVIDSTAMEKLHINDSFSSTGGKSSTNIHFPSPGSTNNVTQPLHPRAQGARGFLPSGHNAFQPGFPLHQVSGGSLPPQVHAVQQSLAQGRVRSSPQGHLHQLGQHPGNGSQISSATKAAVDVNASEAGVRQSSLESSKSKTSLVGKGSNSVQGSVSATFPYGGAQTMVPSGNVGSGPGDQNFNPTPAFLPVMPFGGQHPRGIPAVGMAFPGYVAQKNGVPNTEMTWLPVLAGAAGALGATYCPPYIAIDSAYHSHAPSQTSSSGTSSKESSANKTNNERNHSQRSEAASDEFGQRQKNTRRYTEMNFGK